MPSPQSRLGPELGHRFLALGRRLGARVLTIRRHRYEPSPDVRVFVASTATRDRWVEELVLDTAADLFDRDLGALREDRRVGGKPVGHPLYLVCTNGRHDRCCSVRGGPLCACAQHRPPERDLGVLAHRRRPLRGQRRRPALRGVPRQGRRTRRGARGRGARVGEAAARALPRPRRAALPGPGCRAGPAGARGRRRRSRRDHPRVGAHRARPPRRPPAHQRGPRLHRRGRHRARPPRPPDLHGRGRDVGHRSTGSSPL